MLDFLHGSFSYGSFDPTVSFLKPPEAREAAAEFFLEKLHESVISVVNLVKRIFSSIYFWFYPQYELSGPQKELLSRIRDRPYETRPSLSASIRPGASIVDEAPWPPPHMCQRQQNQLSCSFEQDPLPSALRITLRAIGKAAIELMRQELIENYLSNLVEVEVASRQLPSLLQRLMSAPLILTKRKLEASHLLDPVDRRMESIYQFLLRAPEDMSRELFLQQQSLRLENHLRLQFPPSYALTGEEKNKLLISFCQLFLARSEMSFSYEQWASQINFSSDSMKLKELFDELLVAALLFICKEKVETILTELRRGRQGEGRLLLDSLIDKLVAPITELLLDKLAEQVAIEIYHSHFPRLWDRLVVELYRHCFLLFKGEEAQREFRTRMEKSCQLLDKELPLQPEERKLHDQLVDDLDWVEEQGGLERCTEREFWRAIRGESATDPTIAWIIHQQVDAVDPAWNRVDLTQELPLVHRLSKRLLHLYLPIEQEAINFFAFFRSMQELSWVNSWMKEWEEWIGLLRSLVCSSEQEGGSWLHFENQLSHLKVSAQNAGNHLGEQGLLHLFSTRLHAAVDQVLSPEKLRYLIGSILFPQLQEQLLYLFFSQQLFHGSSLAFPYLDLFVEWANLSESHPRQIVYQTIHSQLMRQGVQKLDREGSRFRCFDHDVTQGRVVQLVDRLLESQCELIQLYLEQRQQGGPISKEELDALFREWLKEDRFNGNRGKWKELCRLLALEIAEVHEGSSWKKRLYDLILGEMVAEKAGQLVAGLCNSPHPLVMPALRQIEQQWGSVAALKEQRGWLRKGEEGRENVQQRAGIEQEAFHRQLESLADLAYELVLDGQPSFCRWIAGRSWALGEENHLITRCLKRSIEKLISRRPLTLQFAIHSLNHLVDLLGKSQGV